MVEIHYAIKCRKRTICHHLNNNNPSALSDTLHTENKSALLLLLLSPLSTTTIEETTEMNNTQRNFIKNDFIQSSASSCINSKKEQQQKWSNINLFIITSLAITILLQTISFTISKLPENYPKSFQLHKTNRINNSNNLLLSINHNQDKNRHQHYPQHQIDYQSDQLTSFWLAHQLSIWLASSSFPLFPRLIVFAEAKSEKSKGTKTTVIAIDGGGSSKGHPVPVPWPVIHCHHHHHHMKYIPKPVVVHHWVKKYKAHDVHELAGSNRNEDKIPIPPPISAPSILSSLPQYQLQHQQQQQQQHQQQHHHDHRQDHPDNIAAIRSRLITPAAERFNKLNELNSQSASPEDSGDPGSEQSGDLQSASSPQMLLTRHHHMAGSLYRPRLHNLGHYRHGRHPLRPNVADQSMIDSSSEGSNNGGNGGSRDIEVSSSVQDFSHNSLATQKSLAHHHKQQQQQQQRIDGQQQQVGIYSIGFNQTGLNLHSPGSNQQVFKGNPINMQKLYLQQHSKESPSTASQYSTLHPTLDMIETQEISEASKWPNSISHASQLFEYKPNGIMSTTSSQSIGGQSPFPVVTNSHYQRDPPMASPIAMATGLSWPNINGVAALTGGGQVGSSAGSIGGRSLDITPIMSNSFGFLQPAIIQQQQQQAFMQQMAGANNDPMSSESRAISAMTALASMAAQQQLMKQQQLILNNSQQNITSLNSNGKSSRRNESFLRPLAASLWLPRKNLFNFRNFNSIPTRRKSTTNIVRNPVDLLSQSVINFPFAARMMSIGRRPFRVPEFGARISGTNNINQRQSTTGGLPLTSLAHPKPTTGGDIKWNQVLPTGGQVSGAASKLMGPFKNGGVSGSGRELEPIPMETIMMPSAAMLTPSAIATGLISEAVGDIHHGEKFMAAAAMLLGQQPFNNRNIINTRKMDKRLKSKQQQQQQQHQHQQQQMQQQQQQQQHKESTTNQANGGESTTNHIINTDQMTSPDGSYKQFTLDVNTGELRPMEQESTSQSNNDDSSNATNNGTMDSSTGDGDINFAGGPISFSNQILPEQLEYQYYTNQQQMMPGQQMSILPMGSTATAAYGTSLPTGQLNGQRGLNYMANRLMGYQNNGRYPMPMVNNSALAYSNQSEIMMPPPQMFIFPTNGVGGQQQFANMANGQTSLPTLVVPFSMRPNNAVVAEQMAPTDNSLQQQQQQQQQQEMALSMMMQQSVPIIGSTDGVRGDQGGQLEFPMSPQQWSEAAYSALNGPLNEQQQKQMKKLPPVAGSSSLSISGGQASEPSVSHAASSPDNLGATIGAGDSGHQMGDNQHQFYAALGFQHPVANTIQHNYQTNQEISSNQHQLMPHKATPYQSSASTEEDSNELTNSASSSSFGGNHHQNIHQQFITPYAYPLSAATSQLQQQQLASWWPNKMMMLPNMDNGGVIGGNGLATSASTINGQTSTTTRQPGVGIPIGGYANPPNMNKNLGIPGGPFLGSNGVGPISGPINWDEDGLNALHSMNELRGVHNALSQSASNDSNNVTAMVRLSRQLRDQMRTLQGRLPQMPQIPNIPQPPSIPNIPFPPPPSMMQMAGMMLPFALARANRNSRNRNQQASNPPNGPTTSTLAGTTNSLFGTRRPLTGGTAAAASANHLRNVFRSMVSRGHRHRQQRPTSTSKSPARAVLSAAATSAASSAASSVAASAASALTGAIVAGAAEKKLKPKMDNSFENGQQKITGLLLSSASSTTMSKLISEAERASRLLNTLQSSPNGLNMATWNGQHNQPQPIAQPQPQPQPLSQQQLNNNQAHHSIMSMMRNSDQNYPSSNSAPIPLITTSTHYPNIIASASSGHISHALLDGEGGRGAHGRGRELRYDQLRSWSPSIEGSINEHFENVDNIDSSSQHLFLTNNNFLQNDSPSSPSSTLLTSTPATIIRATSNLNTNNNNNRIYHHYDNDGHHQAQHHQDRYRALMKPSMNDEQPSRVGGGFKTINGKINYHNNNNNNKFIHAQTQHPGAKEMARPSISDINDHRFHGSVYPESRLKKLEYRFVEPAKQQPIVDHSSVLSSQQLPDYSIKKNKNNLTTTINYKVINSKQTIPNSYRVSDYDEMNQLFGVKKPTTPMAAAPTTVHSIATTTMAPPTNAAKHQPNGQQLQDHRSSGPHLLDVSHAKTTNNTSTTNSNTTTTNPLAVTVSNQDENIWAPVTDTTSTATTQPIDYSKSAAITTTSTSITNDNKSNENTTLEQQQPKQQDYEQPKREFIKAINLVREIAYPWPPPNINNSNKISSTTS